MHHSVRSAVSWWHSLRVGSSLLTFALAVGVQASPWEGQTIVVDGVSHVQNPPMALEPATEWPLEELWRIGGDSEDEGEFFGLITDIAIHPSGEVYLLDMQLSEVKVFTADGEYLRTIGREGEGPGEFRRPSGLFFDPDGHVGVVQGRPARLVMLKTDGTPIEALNLPSPDDGGFRALQRGEYRGGSMVISGRNFRRTPSGMERTSALIRVDPKGNEAARFHEMSSTTNMARMVIQEEGLFFPWTVGPQGNVYAALDRTWKVHVWNPSGQVAHVIELDYEPVMRSKARLEERKKELGSRIQIRAGGGRRVEPEFQVSDRERDIEWISVADDGHLWALSSRGTRDLPDGVLGQFDVFDSSGRYVQQVALRGEGDYKEDLFVLAKNRFFVIKEFAAAIRAMSGSEVDETSDADLEEEPEPMSVLCYKLNWTAIRAAAASSSSN